MKKILITYILIFFFLSNTFAQKNNSKLELTLIEKILINNRLWIDYWKEIDPKFSLNDFNIFLIDSIAIENDDLYYFITEYSKSIDFLYFYSPDKKYFIDIYSYRADLHIENNSYYYGGQVDTKLTIVNTNRVDSCKVLATLGPDCDFEDALWLNNTQFIVFATDSSSKLKPMLIYYDLESKIKKIYYGKDYDIILCNTNFFMRKFPFVKLK